MPGNIAKFTPFAGYLVLSVAGKNRAVILVEF